jgi:hypothetical protein
LDGAELALDAWLSGSARSPSPFHFDVSDFTESGRDRGTLHGLGQMVVRAKTDPSVLERMADVVGWPDAAARLRRGRVGIRRGDFGEALASELLEVFGNLRVPVRKLRYQTDPEQAMHGTDIVGFAIGKDGEIEDLHFVECKLRTYRNLPAGVEAHNQLAKDRAAGYADTLMFLADRLAETEPMLFDAFMSYLKGRARPERGTHGIVLVWELAEWDEDVLTRVNEVESLINPLHIRVVQLGKLATLVEEVYDAIGADVVDDGS